MAKGKRVGKGHETRYSNYKSREVWKKNRQKKLERALRRNPENEQIKQALKSIVYRRKTPGSKVWSSTNRKTAQLLKQFGGYCSPNILSSNKELYSEALKASHPRSQSKAVAGPVSFWLGARAHDKYGNLVWI